MSKRLALCDIKDIDSVEGAVFIAKNRKIEELLKRNKKDYVKKPKVNTVISAKALETFSSWSKFLENSIEYKGIKLWNAIEYSFCSLLFEQKPIIENIRSYTKLLKFFKPSEIIVSTDSLESKILIKLAKKDAKILHRSKKIKLQPNLHKLKSKVNKLLYKNNSPGSDIVFIVPIETAGSIAAPVIKLLEKNHKTKVIRFTSLKERVKKALENHEIGSFPLETYPTDNQIKGFEKDMEHLWRKMNEEHFKEKITIDGINIWDLSEPVFSYYFGKRKFIVDVAAYIDRLNNIIDLENPKIVVMFDESSQFARLTGLVCKKRGVKSVGIQHGIFGYNNLINKPVYYDKILVWGEYTKNILLKRGIEKNKIQVTGSPKFDSLDQKHVKPKKQVLYIGQAFETENEEMLKILVSVTKKLGKTLIIKPHPRSKMLRLYKKLSLEKHVKIIKEANIHKLISESEAVVMESSTVGIEALALKKNVILFESEKPFIQDDFFIRIKNAEELEKALIHSKKKPNALKYLYKLDGKSAERVSKSIEELL